MKNWPRGWFLPPNYLSVGKRRNPVPQSDIELMERMLKEKVEMASDGISSYS